MFTLPVGWTARDEGTCRSCHAAVLWAVSDVTDKVAPFDPIIEGAEVSVSHFATCPEADTWRKKGKHL